MVRRREPAVSTRYPVPGYVPAPVRVVLPWVRQYVARLAARNPQVSESELWDEAVTACVRAAVYFRDGAGTFRQYTQVSVQRACWRYVLPNRRTRHNMRPVLVALEDVPSGALVAPSAEEEATARELVALVDALPCPATTTPSSPVSRPRNPSAKRASGPSSRPRCPSTIAS